MANWYVSREAIKFAAGIDAPLGSSLHSAIDEAIESASRRIDRWTHTFFYPKTETRLYRWPPRQPQRGIELWLDQYLIAVTTLQSEAQNSSPTTISASDFFTEPNNTGPPFTQIEIDQSSTASFSGGDTPQRSISVLGRWGYSEDTRSVGTVDGSGLASSTSSTSFTCSDAGAIDVGDHLLIESEQIFVSERSFAALGSILLDMAGNLAATQNVVTVTVDSSHGIVAGETIRINAERMLIVSVSTNALTVTRAWDGSILAAHTNNDAIHINRTLTIERGTNGTTAATHADTTAISKYEPPFDVRMVAKAEALSELFQSRAGWARSIEAGENAREVSGPGLMDMRKALEPYRRLRYATVR